MTRDQLSRIPSAITMPARRSCTRCRVRGPPCMSAKAEFESYFTCLQTVHVRSIFLARESDIRRFQHVSEEAVAPKFATDCAEATTRGCHTDCAEATTRGCHTDWARRLRREAATPIGRGGYDARLPHRLRAAATTRGCHTDCAEATTRGCHTDWARRLRREVATPIGRRLRREVATRMAWAGHRLRAGRGNRGAKLTSWSKWG